MIDESGQSSGFGVVAMETPMVTEKMIEDICRSPTIEVITPTTEQWDRCETIQDRYDLMKRLVRAALEAALSTDAEPVIWFFQANNNAYVFYPHEKERAEKCASLLKAELKPLYAAAPAAKLEGKP